MIARALENGVRLYTNIIVKNSLATILVLSLITVLLLKSALTFEENMNSKKIAIIGLGYVGLPLAVEFGKKRPVIGFDINQSRIDNLKQRELVIITEDERITYDDTNLVNPIIINNNNITLEDDKPKYNYNDTIMPHIAFKEPLRNQVEDFYNSIVNNTETTSNNELTINVNRLIDRIYVELN